MFCINDLLNNRVYSNGSGGPLVNTGQKAAVSRLFRPFTRRRFGLTLGCASVRAKAFFRTGYGRSLFPASYPPRVKSASRHRDAPRFYGFDKIPLTILSIHYYPLHLNGKPRPTG
jgi:hypothetical protein